MATTLVQQPQSTPSFTPQILNTNTSSSTIKPQDVDTTLNYYKPNADGSPPAPTYINKPETFKRDPEVHNVTIRDLRGKEDQYTLDGNGFQIHKHVSIEKDFLDEEKIKAEYYAETEQLLKDV